jgi:hypothetical protein
MNIFHHAGSRRIAVGIVTSYGMDDRGVMVWCPTGAKVFCFLQSFQTGFRTHLTLCSLGTGDIFPGLKRLDRKTGHSPESCFYGPEWVELYFRCPQGFDDVPEDNIVSPHFIYWCWGLHKLHMFINTGSYMSVRFRTVISPSDEKFERLRDWTMEVSIVYDMALCSVIDICQNFRESFCFRLQIIFLYTDKGGSKFLRNRLHDDSFQRAVTLFRLCRILACYLVYTEILLVFF